MQSADLKDEWDSTMSASGISIETGAPVFGDLARAYREPHRHYHTFAHVGRMLFLLRDAGINDPAGLWATWYHDYVYRPWKNDCETLSADCARSVMRSLSVERSVVEEAVMIIHATRDHWADRPADPVLLAVLDADVAILGADTSCYETYSRSVRAEFKSVPPFLYRRGRQAFLEAVLEQREIYRTEWFGTRFEARARSNIQNELSALAGERVPDRAI